MQTFTWAGMQVHVTRQPKTSDWWEWIAEILPGARMLAAAKFATQFIDVDGVDVERACANDNVFGLVSMIFESCHPHKLTQCLSLTYGADKLDREKIPRACVCDACTGRSARSSDCRFEEAGVPSLTRLVSAQEADLIASMWDLPYSLYHLAVETRKAERLGQLASIYPVEQVRRERTHQAAFERLRRYHGHA